MLDTISMRLTNFLSIFFMTGLAFARPDVQSVHPAAQSMISRNNLEIVVDFDEAIDPETIDSKSFAVFGRWTGVCPGEFQFENNNQRVRFTPARRFSGGEWITVSLAKTISNMSSEEMSQGYAWNFWTSAAPGSLDLQKVATINVRKPGELRIRTYGAYAGDLNGDGFHDFTVPNEDVSDIRVFLNDGTGNYSGFSTISLPANSKPSTNEGADFNGDGILDFACGNITGNSITVFIGDGSGGFKDINTYPASGGVRGLTTLDLDGDGDTDIVTANRSGRNISIFLNNGSGSFAAAQSQNATTNRETACAAADFNEDGILDVVVGSYTDRTGAGEIAVMLGDGKGGLSSHFKRDVGGDCWMLAVGDLNNDGHVDVVSANSWQDQFAVLFGDGTGQLGFPSLYSAGEFPLAIDVGDLDGDGDLEVITSNFETADWILYENNGSGQFINPRRLSTTGAGSCAVLHDRDLDGDLDVTAIDELDDTLLLFENPAKPSSIEDDPVVRSFELQQSYPNPFSLNKSLEGGVLTVPFTLTQSGLVNLDITNIRGQRVARIRASEFPQGAHEITFVPSTLNLSAGVYFYRLAFKNSIQIQKLVVLP